MFKLNSQNISSYAKNVIKYCDQNASQLLFAFGIGLGVSAMAAFAKAGAESEQAINNEISRKKMEIEDDSTDVVMLTKQDIFRVTWRSYVIPVAIGGLSVICLIKSRSLDAKQTALLATMAKASEESLRDYKRAVKEKFGDKKADEVEDTYIEKRMERYPESSCNIYCTGNGDQICFDELSGLYFRSSTEHIKLSLAEATRILRRDDYLQLSQVYELFGLPYGDYAKHTGWNTEYSPKLEYTLTSKLTDTQQPCLVITFYDRPRDNFNGRY